MLALPCLAAAASSSEPAGPEQRQLYSLIASRIKLMQQDMCDLHTSVYSSMVNDAEAALRFAQASLGVLQGCLGSSSGTAAADAALQQQKLQADQLPAAAVPWLALLLRCFAFVGQTLQSPLAAAAAAAAKAAGQQASAGGPATQQLAAAANAAAARAATKQASPPADTAAAAGLHGSNPILELSVVDEEVLGRYQLPMPAALHYFCTTLPGLLQHAEALACILQVYIGCTPAAEPPPPPAAAAVEVHELLAATLRLGGGDVAATAVKSAQAAAPAVAADRKHAARAHAGTTATAAGQTPGTEFTLIAAAAAAGATSSFPTASNSDALGFDVQLLLDVLQQQLLPGLTVLSGRCQQYMAERDAKRQAEQQRIDSYDQQCEAQRRTPAGGLTWLHNSKAAAKANVAAAAGFVEAQRCHAADALRIGVLCSQDERLQLLPDQLQWLESDFAARLPHGWCCNNLASCSNLQGDSELQLVARHSCICAGCGEEHQHAARYCSRQCKEQHWEVHRLVCPCKHQQQHQHQHLHQHQHHHHHHHVHHHRVAAAADDSHGSCCSRCGATGCVLHRCSRCMHASYCSRRCQLMDWEERHKHDCSGSERRGSKQHSRNDVHDLLSSSSTRANGYI
jgi:hypothetical protein